MMERGIRKQAIYRDDMDHQAFIAIMRSALEKNQGLLHAYCMMTNHFHLLLETSDIEPGKFMKQLASCYAIYFNRKYRFSGHLFEGRYKACLVKDDGYFLQSSRYIHLNPVKAGIVEYPEDYPWSSYRTMLGMNDDKMTDIRRTLAYFRGNAVMRYRDFVEDIGHKYVIQENEIKKSIGARRCTQEDKFRVAELTEKYVYDNTAIISEMAKGIDSYAHTACLKAGGYTVAVLGNGLDICYPSEHKKLMEHIVKNGLLISEYPPGTQPAKFRFPRRNRLISAWSDKLIVVAPGKGSGAFITADYERKYGRDVEVIWDKTR